MEITGIVTTGLGKAAYFLGQDFYKNHYRNSYNRIGKGSIFFRPGFL